MKTNLVWLLVGGLLLSCGPAGCGSRKKAKQPAVIEGAVEKVDPSKRRVSFRFVHPKLKQEMSEDVVVGDDTEIMIDGRISSLEDVKEGDSAQVTLWPASDPSKEPKILKVTINRLGHEQPVPATGAVSKPAAK